MWWCITTKGKNFPGTAVSQPVLASDDASQATPSSFSSLRCGCPSLQLPCSWCSHHIDRPLGTPGAAGGLPPTGQGREGARWSQGQWPYFSDVNSVILSWSNLYPAQVAWEEEATAARSLSSPLSLALPACSWGSVLKVLSETQVGAFL